MTDLLTWRTLSDIVLRRELVEAGYTDRDIAKLVQRGELVRLRHGAYADASRWSSADDGGRHMLLSRAVLKQSRTALVLSHVSAVPEYGGPMWGLPLESVHVTRPDRRAGRKEAGVHQHQGLLLPEDVTMRTGVFVTSPVRTAIDITTVVGVEPALVSVNYLLHEGVVTPDQIQARYVLMDHNPHTLNSDLVFRLADPRIESVGESRTFYLMWRQGLPCPEPQYVITDGHGDELARLDFALPDHRTWIEFDGREKYVKFLRDGETVTDVVLREKRREEFISELTGWRCVRLTWADLHHPVRTARRIRAVLR